MWIIAQRELREALRNKWLWLYALAFAALALSLSQAGLASSGYAGLGGFGRTAASLINALLFFVPLMGLSVGANTLAGDRERGTLVYLLAQPVSRAEVFFGKAGGAALALLASLCAGFGVAAVGLATAADSNVPAYLSLAGFSILLALVSLGIGLLISAATRRTATASGAALIAWLAFVFFSDLGFVAATLSLRPSPSALLGLLLVNPLQAFKLAGIYSLRATLDVLGPVGQYAVYKFGAWLPALLLAAMSLWALAAFGAAFALFNRKSDA